jgi:hypothetical protein
VAAHETYTETPDSFSSFVGGVTKYMAGKIGIVLLSIIIYPVFFLLEAVATVWDFAKVLYRFCDRYVRKSLAKSQPQYVGRIGKVNS